MGEHSEFYDKIFERLQANHALHLQSVLESTRIPEHSVEGEHLSHHPDRLIDPTHAADAPMAIIQQRHGAHDAVIEKKRLVLVAPAPIQEQSIAQDNHPLHDAALDEEMRRETVEDMLQHPRQRRFMERVLPIEWCHQRYPEVYKQ